MVPKKEKDFLLICHGQGEYAIIAESDNRASLEAIANPKFHEVVLSREAFEDAERRAV